MLIGPALRSLFLSESVIVEREIPAQSALSRSRGAKFLDHSCEESNLSVTQGIILLFEGEKEVKKVVIFKDMLFPALLYFW